MSMNRFVGLGIFALSASVLVTIAACDDSATTAAPAGGAPATGQGGDTNATTPGAGGATNGTTTAQTGSEGGSSSTSSTGNSSTGGSSSSTTSSSTDCGSDTNLIALADSSETHNWIGGDDTIATDNPCGVQGAIYAYSDDGLDNTPGGTDASVQTPGLDETTDDAKDRTSPCADGKCCISGTTNTWPKNGTTTDYTASVWGGGLGISLNDPGSGGAKLPYSGSVTGFKVKVTGELNGQKLRIGYTQSATDECAPFKEETALGEYERPFTGGIACPTWECDPTCIEPTATPYDIQVQVVGGDIGGDFTVCIESITPML